MIRRFNYTGRKKIGRSQVTVVLNPTPDGRLAFNAFFHLAAVTGLFGLVSFLWFLTRAFKLNMSVLAKGREEKLYGGVVLTSLSAGVLCFLWDTHLLAVMTNWLLGLLFGSLVVMARKEGN